MHEFEVVSFWFVITNEAMRYFLMNDQAKNCLKKGFYHLEFLPLSRFRFMPYSLKGPANVIGETWGVESIHYSRVDLVWNGLLWER